MNQSCGRKELQTRIHHCCSLLTQRKSRSRRHLKALLQHTHRLCQFRLAAIVPGHCTCIALAHGRYVTDQIPRGIELARSGENLPSFTTCSHTPKDQRPDARRNKTWVMMVGRRIGQMSPAYKGAPEVSSGPDKEDTSQPHHLFVSCTSPRTPSPELWT